METPFKEYPWWRKLERRAVRYLSRYPSSEHRFRTTMGRAFVQYTETLDAEQPNKTDVLDALVQYVTHLGYLNDEGLARGLVHSYRRRGDSQRMMRQKLRQKGIKPGQIDQALGNESEGDELAAARRYAQKKKLGIYGSATDYESRRKDLQRMARRGFSYSISMTAISHSEEHE